MENIKTLTVIATIISMSMVIAPAASCDLSFTLQDDDYGTFINQIRNRIKSPYLEYHGLPMMNPPSNTSRYSYINLITKDRPNNQTFTIGLQILTSDMYIVAYRDFTDRRDRAFYFPEAIAEFDVFPNIQDIHREEAKIASDYSTLETAAEQQIHELQLGIKSLENVMRNIYGRKDTSTEAFRRDQARFILNVGFTIAEATLFKYIERNVQNVVPSDYIVKSLVYNWGDLSTQIAKSNATGDFESPVTLQVAVNRYWKITNVLQIKHEIGLLQYVRIGTSTADDEIAVNSLDNEFAAYAF